MSRLILAAGFGLSLGVMTALQFAAPVLAQSRNERSSVYEQLNLFGDIFEANLLQRRNTCVKWPHRRLVV